MADTQSIKLVLELQDKMTSGLMGTNAAIGKANDGLGQMGGMLDALKGGLSNIGLGGATAFLGVGTAVAATVAKLSEMTSTGIELNKTFEATTTRIAGTLDAFHVAPTFKQAKAMAADVLGTIADMAAALPGETEDYVNVFATALPKALSAGMTDMQQVAQFTSYWTAVAASNMVDAQQAGMDLFRMLAGQAGADVRMFTVLAEVIGMTAETFNKLSAPERLAAIQGALGNFSGQLGAAGDEFGAVEGSVASLEKEIQRLGTMRAFEREKEHLQRMNELLKEHRDLLISSTSEVTGMWESIKATASEFWQMEKIGFVILGEQFNKFTKWMQGIRGEGLETGSERVAREREKKERADRLKALAAPEEMASAARAARVEAYYAEGFDKIAAMLPAKMQAAVGPTGLGGGPKVYNELMRIAKSKKDATLVDKMGDFVDYFKLGGGGELFYQRAMGKMPQEQREALEKRKKKETTKAPQTNFYNARFDIKQNFAEGFDPDRIAIAFAQDLARAGEMRTQAAGGVSGQQR